MHHGGDGAALAEQQKNDGGQGAPQASGQGHWEGAGENVEDADDGHEGESNAFDDNGEDWDDYHQEFPLGSISGGVQGLRGSMFLSHGVGNENNLPALDASQQKVWEPVSVGIELTFVA